MSTVPAPPIITPVDRLGLTICLAVICHAIIILGVTFTSEDVLKPRYETMEIVLVQQQDPEPVEDANLLAQANLVGGGTTEDTNPATPLPPPFPDQQAAITAPPEQVAPPPEPVPEQVTEQVTKDNTPRESIDDRMAVETPVPDTQTARPEREQTEPESVKNPIRSATAILRKSFEIASLSARIERKLEQKSRRPKRKYISASTRENIYAAYMDAWRSKVERVGNLNYPEQARKRKISGSLVLEVALNADGSIHEIIITQPSGHKVLDDAAIRIVKLAAPYAPFPESIRKETDILHIIRTWRYKSGSFR